jgi:hypothetical protein
MMSVGIPLGQFQVFPDQGGGTLQNWEVATGVDVMLNPMSWCWVHIPGSQNGGKFLKPNFDICRH